MYYSFRILQLRENGILDKLVHKHFGMLKNQVCAPDHHVAQSTLSVEDVWPVFVVLGAGLALSIIVLLIEHIWSMIMDVCTLLFSVKKNWHSKSGSSYLKCTIIFLVQAVKSMLHIEISVWKIGNSHILQSPSLLEMRWKAVVTLGWMGATFSRSGSWPPRGTAIATRPMRI